MEWPLLLLFYCTNHHIPPCVSLVGSSLPFQSQSNIVQSSSVRPFVRPSLVNGRRRVTMNLCRQHRVHNICPATTTLSSLLLPATNTTIASTVRFIVLFMGVNFAQTHTLICHHRINSFYSQIKMLFSVTLSSALARMDGWMDRSSRAYNMVEENHPGERTWPNTVVAFSERVCMWGFVLVAVLYVLQKLFVHQQIFLGHSPPWVPNVCMFYYSAPDYTKVTIFPRPFHSERSQILSAIHPPSPPDQW